MATRVCDKCNGNGHIVVPTWAVWIFRRHIGWWLEKDGFESVPEAAGFLSLQLGDCLTEDNADVLQGAVVPSGEVQLANYYAKVRAAT